MGFNPIRFMVCRRGYQVKVWITISEAAEIFGLSHRYLHYLARGRPETAERNAKPPILRKIKELPYGQKTMYLLNYKELQALLGERHETDTTNR
jgi:hypothetical protein